MTEEEHDEWIARKVKEEKRFNQEMSGQKKFRGKNNRKKSKRKKK